MKIEFSNADALEWADSAGLRKPSARTIAAVFEAIEDRVSETVSELFCDELGSIQTAEDEENDN